MEHHLSDRITSVENLNIKRCDCITRLESLKDEFNLKAINIKRNLVLETENLKGEITCIRKDIEPTFDKNLIETINQQKSVESKNRYLTLETEEGPTKNKNTRTDSPNTKVTVKQNAINTAAQNKQNSNDKTESDTLDKRKLPVTILLGDSMVKDIKDWKMSSHTRKVVVKHFSGAKTKDMKSYVIPTVRQKPDNIILHTGTNDLKTIDTPEEITMRILNLVMTCKMETDSVFISGIVPRTDKLNEKVLKVNSILRHECDVRNICFIGNKHTSLRFYCNRGGLHLHYYGTKKLQKIFLYELEKLD